MIETETFEGKTSFLAVGTKIDTFNMKGVTIFAHNGEQLSLEEAKELRANLDAAICYAEHRINTIVRENS